MSGVVCAPLHAEHWALRGRVGTRVVHTGRGPDGRVPSHRAGTPTLVAGVGGSLHSDVVAGDLVVADRVIDDRGTETACPSAPLLAGALRRQGLRTHVGGILSHPHVIDGRAREALAETTSALVVDTESGYLAAQAPAGQFAVVRAVTDTPDAGLVSATTPLRGAAGLNTLRKAAPVLAAWADAAGDRTILLAAPRSFCAGVDRAIESVRRALQLHGPPVYVRRQIVHNAHVVADLERGGAVFVTEVDEIPEGGVMVLAAHGVAPQIRARADERRLHVIDATCPLVTKVHNEVRRFAARDHTIFLIGHDDHEEVIGTRGEAPDNVVVIGDPDEAAVVDVPDDGRVSYVMQTTLAVEDAMRTVDVLHERFPELEAPRKDDICYATANRQQAVRAIAEKSDLVLVVGSQNSSNSHRLAEVAEAEGVMARLVDDPADVELGWLIDAGRVGITAGASAPPHLVDELIDCLSGLGQTTVTQTETVSENVRFALPREVS